MSQVARQYCRRYSSDLGASVITSRSSPPRRTAAKVVTTRRTATPSQERPAKPSPRQRAGNGQQHHAHDQGSVGAAALGQQQATDHDQQQQQHAQHVRPAAGRSLAKGSQDTQRAGSPPESGTPPVNWSGQTSRSVRYWPVDSRIGRRWGEPAGASRPACCELRSGSCAYSALSRGLL